MDGRIQNMDPRSPLMDLVHGPLYGLCPWTTPVDHP